MNNKHLLSSLIFLFSVLIWSEKEVEAKNLYVNNSGSPVCSDETTYENNSPSNPWCTIGRAAWGSMNRSSPNSSEAARAGDTVYISAGTYHNVKPDGVGPYYIAYNPINSGAVDRPIVFEAIGTVILTQNGSLVLMEQLLAAQ